MADAWHVKVRYFAIQRKGGSRGSVRMIQNCWGKQGSWEKFRSINPFYLPVISEMFKQLGDPDWEIMAITNVAEEIFVIIQREQRRSE